MIDTCEHGRLLESFYSDPDNWEPCKDCLIESLRNDTIKVSELRSYCEVVLEEVRFQKEQCDNYSNGWMASEYIANDIIKRFCKEQEPK